MSVSPVPSAQTAFVTSAHRPLTIQSESGETVHIVATDAQGNLVTGNVMLPFAIRNYFFLQISLACLRLNIQKPLFILVTELQKGSILNIIQYNKICRDSKTIA